jgi:uncharacterized membrane protein
MPSESKTGRTITTTLAKWEHYLLTGLLLGIYALVLARLWWPIALPGKPGWPEPVLLALAAVSTIAALARHLPLQNILFAALIILLADGAATWLDLKTGIPFGPFSTGDNVGPRLLRGMPWMLPVIWVVALLNSRGVARLILRPWRKIHSYGLWLLGLTAGLTAVFDFALDPFASRVNHFWIWGPTKFPLSWQGAPGVSFFCWAVVALLILAFITPLLINKQPHNRPPPDFHPLGVWLGGVLLFGVGAASAGLWSAVALDGIIGVGVAVSAIRGARW